MTRTLLPLLCFGVMSSACATVTQGANEGLVINSDPGGAVVKTDIPSQRPGNIDGFLGCEATPCSISMPRKRSPVVTVSLDGHDPIAFKVTSAVATSATSIQTGSIVSGIPPGSHVVVGTPDTLKRIPVGGRVVTGGLLTFGAASVVDIAVGANKNLSPNPVTVFLAPVGEDVEEAD